MGQQHNQTNTPATFQLTQSQLLLWTGQKLNPDSALYNMVLTFELKGAIDIPVFQKAFQLLVERSDALRTVFGEKSGQPFQKVLSDFPYEVELLDYSKTENPSSVYQSWLKKRSQINFDISKILFDSVLVKLSENHYIWYFNQHHLITDARAVSVLYKALSEMYKKLQKGEVISSASFPSFQKYVAFEHSNYSSPLFEKAKTYWEEQILKIPATPRLYGKTGIKSTTHSKRIAMDLGPDRSSKIRAISTEKDIRSWTAHLTKLNIFLTLLYTYIYRVSGEQKLAIGTPSHNRPTREFKETPGLFIEIFPLMVKVDKNDTFTSLLQRVRNETNAFLKYGQSGAGNPKLSRSFNVVLNYINAAFCDFTEEISMHSEWIHPDQCDPNHHLRLQVHDFDASGSIQLYFDLNTNIFDKELQQAVPIHFLNLLDAFLKDRNQPIEQAGLCTESEFKKTIIDFNHNALSFTNEHQNILDRFQIQAQITPEATSCLFEEKKMTYEELDKRSGKLASYLNNKGISKGSKVAIFLNRSFELIVGVLASFKTGAAFIPIAANYPPERVQYMLEDSCADIVLTDHITLQSLNYKLPHICLDTVWASIEKEEVLSQKRKINVKDLAYIMYTSGSTGTPKGVEVSHGALMNYIQFANLKYLPSENVVFPLFTMISFDLTITSVFVPLTSGGTIVIYKESESLTDLSLFQVIEDNKVNIIKLTPSHLRLLKGRNLKNSNIRTMIVGGEDFKADLAKSTRQAFHPDMRIFNEYGPTEATVGCVVHQFDKKRNYKGSVCIGKPIQNIQAYVLDDYKNPVPIGVSGELYIAGAGLANGYWNKPALTEKLFLPNPFEEGSRMYRTGDFVRFGASGELEYLGRKDEQIKIGGIRIELGEIEAALKKHPEIQDCIVLKSKPRSKIKQGDIIHCSRCGLPSNYPNAIFDETKTCHLCNAFETYQKKAVQYFKNKEDLQYEFEKIADKKHRAYDCMMLLSGGKDSTYALAQLVDMDIKVLAFTLDNGYISDQAKTNIIRVVEGLGVDHIFGKTEAMDAIFVDSLQRHQNVCNGCFKTLYTLSTQIALEKNIPYIVTGLSRGQFFETRLTEELFWKEDVDVEGIDQIILNARKAYHRIDDAIARHLDVSIFEDDEVFEKVKFLDFYRYCDVSMDEMMVYLDEQLPWVRPTDTGRSTNCLINQVGIYVHKKEHGFSNYAFPYSWDVRLGHKERDAALEEINEEIDIPEVHRIMAKIGYSKEENETDSQAHLVAFYIGSKVSSSQLRTHLALSIPSYMIPSYFKSVPVFPMAANGKIDRKALVALPSQQPVFDFPYTEPGTEIEALLTTIWSEVLEIPKIGIHYNFLELGGNSLKAIRLISRINEAFEMDIPVNNVFEMPTIAAFALHIEKTLTELLDEFS